MSQPASDSNEPRPAVSARTPEPAPEQEFDLLAFWIENRKLILRIVALALLAVAVWGVFLFMDYRRRSGSESALANATTPEQLRQVTTEWAGTPAAGTAYVVLAEMLLEKNQPKEAAGALKEFIDKYPQHPLRVAAAHAQAVALETAGELEAALAAFQNFGIAHQRSAFAPLGPIGQARVLIALGKPDEARLILDTIGARFPGNPFTYEASVLLEPLKNAAGMKTGGAPRPAPAPDAKTDNKPVVTPDAPPTPAGANAPKPVPAKPAQPSQTTPKPAPAAPASSAPAAPAKPASPAPAPTGANAPAPKAPETPAAPAGQTPVEGAKK